MRQLFLSLALACALPGAAAADVYYNVGAAGPYASLGSATAQVWSDYPGPFSVTVHVRVLDAVTGPLDLDAGTLPLQPQAGFRLVYESAPGVAATVSGAGSYGLRISGVANVTVQNLGVQGFSVNALRLVNCAGAQVARCRLAGGGAAALQALACPGLQLSNTLLQPSTGSGAILSGCAGALLNANQVPAGAGLSYGLVLQNSDQAVLDHNRADGADNAFNVFSSAGVSVTANVAILRGGNRGLVLDNAPSSVVALNLLVGQAVGVELQSSTGCAVVQNTIWEHGTAGLYAHSACTALYVQNNLWPGFLAYFLDASTQAGLASDHNDFQYDGQLGLGASSYPQLSDWKATGQDAAAAAAAPLFAQSAGTQPEHYKLSPGSSARGLGAPLVGWLTRDYFGNPLPPPAATPWDAGFHAASALQNTPTNTPTPSPVLPTGTPTATASPTISPTFTISPPGTLTPTPTPSQSFTRTQTFTVTPYPIQRGKVIAYPNPSKPEAGGVHFVFDPADSATLRIYDMATHLVVEIPGSAVQAAQGHALWDGRDRNGQLTPSGLYLCVVATPAFTHFTRFTVLH